MAQRPAHHPERYFGRGYYHLYKHYLLPEQQTNAEVDFLLRALRPRASQRWLDAPCGYGRHLKSLSARRSRLRLFGVDLNPGYLREDGLGQAARLCLCDYRRLPFAAGSFHVVLNLLNSFGYYPPVGREGLAARDDRAVLGEWARVLKPGGRLVMDLPNRQALIALVARRPLICYRGGGYEARERFAWDPRTQCLENRTRWRWPGGEERARYRFRLYTPAQIGRMLERAGLERMAIHGDFNAAAFDPLRSDQMLVLAGKR